MYQAQIGDALHALWRQNVQNAFTGSYVESGLGATPGSSGTSIQVDVDPGDVRIDDSPLSVAGDTLTFDPVSTDGEYRADVIYVTPSGGLAVEKGNSAQPKPTISGDPYPTGDPQPARRLFAPSPPDGSSINGLPIRVVMIADTTSDSTDLALEDLVDYRISPPLPGDHTHPEFAKNRRTELLDNPGGDQYVKLATIHDGTGGTGAAIRFVGWRANERTIETNRLLDVSVDTGASQYDVDAFAYGTRQQATDIIVTEESASNAGTAENKYHLYAYLPSNAFTYANMAYVGGNFGEWQYIDGLGSNDLLGTVVWDTGNSTGGPGGETAVPKASSKVRGDVEGNSDIASLTSASGAAGEVPVADASGGTGWKPSVYQPGDWVPLATSRFPEKVYTRSGGDWGFVTGRTAGVVFPTQRLNNRMFDAIGISMTASLKSDTTDARSAARLSGTPIGTIFLDTEINNYGTDFAVVGSQVEAIGTPDADDFHLQVFAPDGSTTTCSMPTVHVFGRMT